MFDAHTHADRLAPEALRRAREHGIQGLIVAGVDPVGWQTQAEMRHPWVWHAYGLHPWTVATMDDEGLASALDGLRSALDADPDKVVGVGETGLDHGKRLSKESHSRQEVAFRSQIRMARERHLPLVLHIVRSYSRALAILREEELPSQGGMVHSFSGSAEDARALIDQGMHISFSGSITRANAHRMREAAAVVPLQMLLVETDSPDQTPQGRQPAPNEPAFLIDVIAAVAQARGETPNQIIAATNGNARRLFRLPNA